MCYVEVTCHNCGAVFQLYFDGNTACRCPHCLAEMPSKCIDKLRNAMYCTEEVNKDFRVAHDEKDKPLFQAEIKNHYVPNDKFNL